MPSPVSDGFRHGSHLIHPKQACATILAAHDSGGMAASAGQRLEVQATVIGGAYQMTFIPG
jgi:hypothetical protein